MGLAVNVAAKKIPIENFNFTKSIDLEATEASDPITAMMNDGEKYFQRRYTELTTDDENVEAEEGEDYQETPQDDDYAFKGNM